MHKIGESGLCQFFIRILSWIRRGNDYLADRKENSAERKARQANKQAKREQTAQTRASFSPSKGLFTHPIKFKKGILTDKDKLKGQVLLIEGTKTVISEHFKRATELLNRRIHAAKKQEALQEKLKGAANVREVREILKEIEGTIQDTNDYKKRMVSAKDIKLVAEQAGSGNSPLEKLLAKQISEKKFDPELDVLSTEDLLVLAHMVKHCDLDKNDQQFITETLKDDFEALEIRIKKSMEKRIKLLEKTTSAETEGHTDLLFDFYEDIRVQLKKDAKLGMLPPDRPLAAPEQGELEEIINPLLVDDEGKPDPKGTSQVFQKGKTLKEHMEAYLAEPATDHKNKPADQKATEVSAKVKVPSQEKGVGSSSPKSTL